jgi:hypothetical protein
VWLSLAAVLFLGGGVEAGCWLNLDILLRVHERVTRCIKGFLQFFTLLQVIPPKL